MSDEVMLISPPFDMGTRGVFPPLGLASLAAELRNNGYDERVSIVDGCYLAQKHGYKQSMKMVEAELERRKPFVVGCSLQMYTLEGSLRAAFDAIKNGSHVIFGGYMASAIHKDLTKVVYDLKKELGFSSEVAVVRGEGEKTIKEITDALFHGKELYGIKGVTFHDGKEVVVNPDREPLDLNSLHPPALDMLPPLSEYDNKEGIIEESRGCVFNCSFCSIQSTHTSPRMKSPENIRREAEVIKKIGFDQLGFIGELLLLDGERTLKIADHMEELDMKWSADAHPSLVVKQRKILPKLAEKGLFSIEIGIESATQHSLDILGKGTTPAMNRKALNILKDSNIGQAIDFINFNPEMNMRDVYHNIMLLDKYLPSFYNQPVYPLNLLHRLAPNPGTPIYERLKADGILTDKDCIMRLKYKSRRVAKVIKGYEYFLEKYLDAYRPRFKKVLDLCDAEHGKVGYSDNRINAAVKPPILAMFISYRCAMFGLDPKEYIDYMVDKYFQMLDAGNLLAGNNEVVDYVFDKMYKDAKTRSAIRNLERYGRAEH